MKNTDLKLSHAQRDLLKKVINTNIFVKDDQPFLDITDGKSYKISRKTFASLISKGLLKLITMSEYTLSREGKKIATSLNTENKKGFKVESGHGDPCFACDKKLNESSKVAYTGDGQSTFVGAECFRLIKRGELQGYQPPKGGPKLYAYNPGEFHCCGGNDEFPPEHTQDCDDHGNPEWISRVNKAEKEREVVRSKARLTKAQEDVILSAGDSLFFTNSQDGRSYYRRTNGMTSLINAKVFDALKKLGAFGVTKNDDKRSEYHLSNVGLEILNDLRLKSARKGGK